MNKDKHAMFDHWVLDATMGWPPCFCPIEGSIDGDFTVVTGMNVITDEPPGKVVAIIHEDGDVAVEEFCRLHEDDLKKMFPSMTR